jgi:hypothetical protein
MTLEQINHAILMTEQERNAFVGGCMGIAKRYPTLNTDAFSDELAELVGEHYHDALTSLREDRDRIIARQQDAERMADRHDYERRVF